MEAWLQTDVRGKGIPRAKPARGNKNRIFLSTASHTDPPPVCNSLCTECISHTSASYSANGHISHLFFKISVYCIVYVALALSCLITRQTTAHNGMVFSWVF